MKPSYKHAGTAGIVTGVCLLFEFIFFMASGLTPDKLAGPVQAVSLIQHKETLLRIAAVFGFSGAIISMVYVAGLAERLRTRAPSRAAAVLYFGIAGSIGHSLVALSYYLGFPVLVTLAHDHMPNAINTWGAFQAITYGFQGLGNILLGLMLLLAGSAILTARLVPRWLGWIGSIGGAATVLGVLITATALGALGYVAYLPSIVLAIIFDIGVGRHLTRIDGRQSGES